VGCGNQFASDEAVGLEVVSQLRRVIGHVCEVHDCRTVSPALLSSLGPETVLIYVDAVRTGARPGTIHGVELHCGQEPSVVIRSEIQLLLNRAKKLPQAYFIGIEIEKWDPGIGVTTSVHSAALEVVRELAKINGKGQPKLPFFTETPRSD
jgi:hydrogenase maturation protease